MRPLYLAVLAILCHNALAASVIISKLSADSKTGILKRGIDRCARSPLKVIQFPKELKVSQFINTIRGDSTKPGPAFSFNVNKPVMVYLLVHKRGNPQLPGWKKTTAQATWQLGTYKVRDKIYMKAFKAGRIAIPEHNGHSKTLYGVSHMAVVQDLAKASSHSDKIRTAEQFTGQTSTKTVAKAPNKVIASKISDGASLSTYPRRIIMGNITMVTPYYIFDNARYISIARGNSAKPGAGFSFYINHDSDIYIAVHKRGTPNIPLDWKKTKYVSYWRHGSNVNEDDIYKKHFKAGIVKIPPNPGFNGSIYAIPNAAIILQPDQKQKFYEWTSDNFPRNIETTRNITWSLPAGKLENGKVYLFCLFLKSKKNNIVKLHTSPKLGMPFGSNIRTEGIWEKIYFPFVTNSDATGKNIKFTLTIPARTQIKAPCIDENKSGILPDENQVVKYLPGKRWKSVNMGKGNKFFKGIKPGSALDFDNIVPRIPAGSEGRVTINSKGQLVFDKTPKKTILFRSCAFPFRICKTTKDIDDLISLLCLQGYNMVRFHGVLEKLSKNKYCKFGVTIDNAKFIPQTKDDFEKYFDKQKLKLFEYLLYQLGKHGIYVYMDAMTRFTGFTDATQSGHWIGKDLLAQQFHAQLYVNPAFRRNWKQGITYILNHTNSFNGKKIKDDPVIACILFMNEQNFRLTPSFLKAFDPEWNKFYGKGAPQLSEKLLRSESGAGKKAGLFMQKKIEEMTQFFRDSIREAGYKGLVSNWDLYMRMIDAPGREMLQVVSMHSYHGHPGLPRNDKSVPGYNVSTSSGNKEIYINRKSSIKEGGSYMSRIMAMQHAGRPSMLMEYGDTPPNPYRHEAGLFVASYAKLNGVDVLMPHGDVLSLGFQPISPYSYSSYSDPIFRASDVINIFAFLRGDVKTGKHSVEFLVTPQILASANRIDALAAEYAQTFLLTKIGTRYTAGKAFDQVGNINADLEIVPQIFARARGASVEAVTTDYEEKRPNIIREIVKRLKDKNILTENNRTDVDKNIFESETNELLFMPEKGCLYVTTPRLEGAVVKDNNAVKLKSLNIDYCSVPAAVSMISLNADKTLHQSQHLLLVFSTDAVNLGMVTNKSGSRMLKTGSAPILMRTGKITLTLKNIHKNTPHVYSLNLDGSRAEEVKATQDNSGLHLSIDTSSLKFCTPFFEVIY